MRDQFPLNGEGRKRIAAVVGTALLGLGLTAPTAMADVTTINGLDFQLRNIWNQYPDSPLSVNGVPEASLPGGIPLTTSVPGEVRIDGEFLRIEEGPLGNFDFNTGLPFKANSHRAWFSDDAGASRFEFQEAFGFDISVDIQITTSANSPRKEAGFFWDIGTGSDPQFLITTDNGEIAAFAGTHPKASSVGNQGPDGLEFGGELYQAGDTANLRMVYIPPVRDPNTGQPIAVGTMQYFFNDTPAYDEPIPFNIDIPQIAGILPGSELALKVQTQGESFSNDATTATYVFSNLLITIPPVSALTGDYDVSGQVEQGDLDIVLQNWGTGTFTGDENALPGGGPFDGTVDQNELDGVLQNWGSTAAPSFDGGVVPEPAALSVLLVATLGVRRQRREP